MGRPGLRRGRHRPAYIEEPPVRSEGAGRPGRQGVVGRGDRSDSTPAEFESKTLRVEKVVPAGGKITVRVRALQPGRYRFFDDYHEDTTEGFLIVK